MLIPEIAESPLSATNEPFLCEREHNKRVEAGLWCQQNSELCARRLTDMLHASKVLMADLKIRVVAPENPSPIPDIKGAAIWRVTARRERTAASGPADREPVSFRYSPCQGRLEKQ